MVPRSSESRAKRAALVVNSGNANAFTGKSGRAATKLTADIAAKAAGCKPAEIFLASTGVIGEPLDAAKFAPRDGKAWPRGAKAGDCSPRPRRS